VSVSSTRLTFGAAFNVRGTHFQCRYCMPKSFRKQGLTVAESRFRLRAITRTEPNGFSLTPRATAGLECSERLFSHASLVRAQSQTVAERGRRPRTFPDAVNDSSLTFVLLVAELDDLLFLLKQKCGACCRRPPRFVPLNLARIGLIRAKSRQRSSGLS
jgi:hypothetical protein